MLLDKKKAKKYKKYTQAKSTFCSQGKLSNGVKNWHDLTLPNFAHLRGKITFHHAKCDKAGKKSANRIKGYK